MNVCLVSRRQRGSTKLDFFLVRFLVEYLRVFLVRFLVEYLRVSVSNRNLSELAHIP